MQSYLIMMAVRLIELRRVLRADGSLYLHCDPTASHYLKALLDAVFGRRNFRNEIVWCYTGPGSPGMRQFNRKHDTIFWFSKSVTHWRFNGDAVRIQHHGKTKANFKEGLRGSGFVEGRFGLTRGKIPESWWAQAKGNGLAIAARHKSEYVGYPTQKPLALLDRIIKASSQEGDLVLDPFCGCATTLVAADRLQRQWAGIDLSPLAIKLVNERIADDRGPLWGGATALDLPPVRTDLGQLPNYRTHRHRLYGEQEGVCAGCTTHFPFRVMDVDHILPRSKGGTDHASNLQLLCSGCNRSKGGRTMAEWRAGGGT